MRPWPDSFAATLRIAWGDPQHLRVGEAGAVFDESIGARDITFRHER